MTKLFSSGKPGRDHTAYRHVLDRITRIHAELKAHRYPNAGRLAKELEVSRKTIQRDLDYMRDRRRLPIEYSARHRGFFYSHPVPDRLPEAVELTEAEIFAMLVAHKAVAQYQGTPFEQPLAAAFERICATLNDEDRYSVTQLKDVLSFRPFGPEETDLKVFQVVSQAVAQRRVLRFEYRKPLAATSTSRRVEPYHLINVENRWFLLTRDLVRQEKRTFTVARISAPALCEETFERPADFKVEDHLKSSFSILRGDDPDALYDVVIELDAWATEHARSRTWHGSQQTVLLPCGASRMRFRLSALEEVERWVLSWGHHAAVIQPESLRLKVMGHVSGILKFYQEHSTRSEEVAPRQRLLL
jgi:predicted DNA-binding transcriptional regulator YafY